MIRGIGRRFGRSFSLPSLLLCAFVVWILTAVPPAGFPILEYHMVTENPRPDAEPYVVPPEEFAAQLDYLREEGYTTITPGLCTSSQGQAGAAGETGYPLL